MNDQQKAAARTCLDGAEENTMTFPQIVGTLIEAGFESYAVDFRRATAIYYLHNGKSTELPTHALDIPVAASFNAARIQFAIKEAQQLVTSYTYKGFCKKVASASCAGYVVSFTGRRALYIGRTAETHVEHFPN
jgi:uncharacterized protein YbcV (DUF1398 family)